MSGDEKCKEIKKALESANPTKNLISVETIPQLDDFKYKMVLKCRETDLTTNFIQILEQVTGRSKPYIESKNDSVILRI